MADDDVKGDLTRRVDLFERQDELQRAATAGGLSALLGAYEPWADSYSSWGWTPGWDTYPNLIGRFRRAREAALIATRTPNAAPQSVAAAAASGAAEGLGQGERNLEQRGQDLVDAFRNATESGKAIAASVPTLVYVLVAAIALGLLLRARG